MEKCKTCEIGDVRDQKVEKWIKRGTEWVLLKNIPALVCDACGERSYTQKVAELMGRIASPQQSVEPTGLDQTPHLIYDLDEMRGPRRVDPPQQSDTGTKRVRAYASSGGEISYHY